MNQLLSQTTLTLVFFLIFISQVFAKVPPSPINQDAKVSWSKVLDDPFEGKIVYDKDFDGYGSSAIVSSWSKDSIRLSFFWQERTIDYYRQVQRTRKVKRGNRYEDETYWESEPVYKYQNYSKSPEAIKFSINGQVYTYEGGKVSEDLASALATAPNQNMKIRIIWEDASTTDSTIGSGTVKAWKEIYGN